MLEIHCLISIFLMLIGMTHQKAIDKNMCLVYGVHFHQHHVKKLKLEFKTLKLYSSV